MSKEIFKDIPDYKGMYQVSNLGNVKSLNYNRTKKERLLKLINNHKGYLMVGLTKNGKMKMIRVHQLVAITFLNHIRCGMNIVVDHIDNNQLNNKLENIQLITHRENTSKDKNSTSSKYTGVSWQKDANKWRVMIYIKGVQKYLGLFKDEYKAHLAYQKELIINTKKK